MKIEITQDEKSAIEDALLTASIQYLGTMKISRSSKEQAAYWKRKAEVAEALRKRFNPFAAGVAGAREIVAAGRVGAGE